MARAGIVEISSAEASQREGTMGSVTYLLGHVPS